MVEVSGYEVKTISGIHFGKIHAKVDSVTVVCHSNALDRESVDPEDMYWERQGMVA